MDSQEDQNMATLLGYEELKLSRQVNGKASIKVKCLPVRQLAEYAAVIDIETEVVALCTDLTDAEIDLLSTVDSGRIFEKAHELNFEPFSAWLRRKVAAEKLKAQAYGIDLPQQSSSSMADGKGSAKK